MTATSSTASGAAPLSVAILTEHFPPHRGGMATSADRLTRTLRKQGVETTIVHLSRRALREEQRRLESGWQLTVPLNNTDPSFALHLAYLALERQPSPPQVVIAFGGSLALTAAPVFGAWLGCPTLAMLRGNDFDAAVFSQQRQGGLLRTLSEVDAVTTVARVQADRGRALVPTAHVHALFNGIEAEFAPTAKDLERAQAFRSATVEDGRLLIGVVGQLKTKKGVAFLLEEIQASAEAERLHVHLVGQVSEELRAFIDAQAPRRKYGFSEEPFRDRHELLSLYPAFDAVGVPSFFDGMPNVVLEAMALGVPVLGAQAGGIPDVVRDRESGFLFAPGDRGELQRGLLEFVGQADVARAAMSRAATVRVREHFTAEREAHALIDVIRQTLTKEPSSCAR